MTPLKKKSDFVMTPSPPPPPKKKKIHNIHTPKSITFLNFLTKNNAPKVVMDATMGQFFLSLKRT